MFGSKLDLKELTITSLPQFGDSAVGDAMLSCLHVVTCDSWVLLVLISSSRLMTGRKL